MPKLITTQQLFDEYVAMNDKLQTLIDKEASNKEIESLLTQIKDIQDQIKDKHFPDEFKISNDLLDVKRVGRDAEIETLLNGEWLDPGGSTGRLTIDPKGCSRIIIAVNADVKWRMGTSSFWSNVVNYNHTYPRRFDPQDAAPNANYPSETVIGIQLNNATSYYDALRNGYLPANMSITVYNRDDTDGIFTVRIMRLWEV